MRAYVLAAILSGGLFSGAVFADGEVISIPAPEASSSDSTSSTALEKIKPKRFDEDKRINDLQLRAEGGSLSRYSTKFKLDYSGSPINELQEPTKPNPDPSKRAGDMRTSLSGNANLRYRVDRDTGLTVGTGLIWYAPFQAITNQDVKRPKNSKTYDVSNPGVGLDRNYLLGGVQSRSSVLYTQVTDDYYRTRGQNSGINFSQYAKWVVAQSRLILGAQISANYYNFNRDYYQGVGPKHTGSDGPLNRYTLNLIPSVEYKLTENLNFNTSLGYTYGDQRLNPSWVKWAHQLSTWRVGVGWAITHDIYVNPYVNFFAEAPAFNTASLNFSTVFSIF